MLQRIAELAKELILGVAEASVSFIANDKATTAAYTGRQVEDLRAWGSSRHEHPE